LECLGPTRSMQKVTHQQTWSAWGPTRMMQNVTQQQTWSVCVRHGRCRKWLSNRRGVFEVRHGRCRKWLSNRRGVFGPDTDDAESGWATYVECLRSDTEDALVGVENVDQSLHPLPTSFRNLVIR
jgi:hypothetical protein